MKNAIKILLIFVLVFVLAIGAFGCENVNSGETINTADQVSDDASTKSSTARDTGSVDKGSSVGRTSIGARDDVYYEAADGGFGGFGGYGGKVSDAVIGGVPGTMPIGYGDTPEGQYVPKAGQMTASAHNDNDDYEGFIELYKKGDVPYSEYGYGYDYGFDYGYDRYDDAKGLGDADEVEVSEPSDSADSGEVEDNEPDAQPDGKFYDFYENDRWGFDATKRVTVRVKCGEQAVAGATVEYYLDGQKACYALTDANGVAHIFPDGENGTFTVKAGAFSERAFFNKDSRDIEVPLGGTVAKANIIKLMFVVDVTGSMGDEIIYLASELSDVIRRVAANNDGVRIDLAFLFYRDDGDDEKFSYNDFVVVSDEVGLAEQMRNLKKQYADGGGDYPEALDEALDIAVNKDWGEENSTNIIFHVYDAPAHTEASNKTRFEQAIRTAAKKGIRINPVLCSGADLLCEYLARQAAIHTEGHFVYVTDDSGIGGSHRDPEIESDVVEKLNELMIRLIDGYYTGVFAPAVDWKE